MEAKREWNIMSQEDRMLMALVGIIKQAKGNGNPKKENKSNKKCKQGEDDDGKKDDKPKKEPKKPLTVKEKANLKESKIPY